MSAGGDGAVAGGTQLAARVGGAYDLRVDATCSVPDLAGCPKGTLCVRSVAASVCGSDCLFVAKPRAVDVPSAGASMHEAVGVVTQVVGSDEHGCVDGGRDDVKVGDVVMALPSNYIRAHPSVTRDLAPDQAAAVEKVPLTGAGAQYFLGLSRYAWVVPADTEVPKYMFVAAQPLGTVLWAMRKLGDTTNREALKGMTAAVLGQGQNGLLFTAMLHYMGADRVIAIDRNEYRLEASKAMNATDTVLAKPGDEEHTKAQVLELTGGKGADIVVEAVGHQTQTLNEAIRLAAFLGRVVAFGVPGDAVYPVDFSTLFRRNVALLPSVFPDGSPTGDFSQAMDMVASKAIPIAPIFSHVVDLEDLPKAVAVQMARERGVIKSLVVSGADEAAEIRESFSVLNTEGAVLGSHAP